MKKEEKKLFALKLLFFEFLKEEIIPLLKGELAPEEEVQRKIDEFHFFFANKRDQKMIQEAQENGISEIELLSLIREIFSEFAQEFFREYRLKNSAKRKKRIIEIKIKRLKEREVEISNKALVNEILEILNRGNIKEALARFKWESDKFHYNDETYLILKKVFFL